VDTCWPVHTPSEPDGCRTAAAAAAAQWLSYVWGVQMMRLAAKEADLGDMQTYVLDLAVGKTPSVDFTRQHFTDPAVNVEFHLMRTQLVEM
jgi:WTAP/Mum2p family